jgi:hypothetical protein
VLSLNIHFGRAAVVLVVAGLAIAAATAGVLSRTMWNGPVPIHVRWKSGTSDAERVALEQRFHLTDGVVTEGTTRAYLLADLSTDNIRALVQHPSVDDTADVNRIRFRPRFSNDRQRRLIFFPVVAGGVGAVAILGLLIGSRSRWLVRSDA